MAIQEKSTIPVRLQPIINRIKDNPQIIDQIEEKILDGLNTDGGHHKQYYLEKVLLILFGEEKCNELKKKRPMGRWYPGLIRNKDD